MVLIAEDPVQTQDLPDWYISELRRPNRRIGALERLIEPKEVNSLAHFEWFVNRLKLEDGRSMRLEPFQRLLLAGYFAGVTETAIILPKKNGKTMIMALLALHHMIYEVDEADVIIAASSKEQAAKLYQYAEGLILRNPRLSAVVKPQGGYRRIVFVDHKLTPARSGSSPMTPPQQTVKHAHWQSLMSITATRARRSTVYCVMACLLVLASYFLSRRRVKAMIHRWDTYASRVMDSQSSTTRADTSSPSIVMSLSVSMNGHSPTKTT
jgi:hypothetical protein